jgi:hypothetical protein
MPVTSQEPIEQAERELAEVKGLVDEQWPRHAVEADRR